ncbi:MAG: hypothetical protein R3C69_08195 [Geminicoccaceae bacterium]
MRFEVDILDRAEGEQPGIVAGDVEPAVGLGSRRDQRPGQVRVGDVAGDRARRAQLGHERLEAIGAAAGQDQLDAAPSSARPLPCRSPTWPL